MRYRDIIAEEIGDTWEQRHAASQRQQAKHTKSVTKLRNAQTKAADQARSAAAKRADSNNKIRDAQKEVSNPPTP